jgi:hypothetical protein
MTCRWVLKAAGDSCAFVMYLMVTKQTISSSSLYKDEDCLGSDMQVGT